MLTVVCPPVAPIGTCFRKGVHGKKRRLLCEVRIDDYVGHAFHFNIYTARKIIAWKFWSKHGELFVHTKYSLIRQHPIFSPHCQVMSLWLTHCYSIEFESYTICLTDTAQNAQIVEALLHWGYRMAVKFCISLVLKRTQP